MPWILGWFTPEIPPVIETVLKVGVVQLYRVLMGIRPLLESVGVRCKEIPLHVTVVMLLMIGVGKSVTTTENGLPCPEGEVGVTV
jgi:hypothetical protein